MRWLGDPWLEAGFPTYGAARMRAALDPASEAWQALHRRDTPSASAVDAFLAGHPALAAGLRQQVLRSADEPRRPAAIRARLAP